MEETVIFKKRSLFAVLCILLVFGCSSGGGSDDPDNPDNPGGDPTPVNTVKTPTFNYESGSYSSILTLTMSCETAGATIHYTLDGSAPTVDSTTYTGIIPILDKKTVKAIAIKDGMNISAVATAEFEFHVYGRNESGDGGAYYYKDGVKIYLTMPADRQYFAPRGVFQNENGKVYVFGFTYNNEISSISHPDSTTTITTYVPADNQPCYWIDGTYHALPLPPDCTEGIVTYTWAFYQGKFYLPGQVNNDEDSFPCYWREGECVVLDSDGNISDDICVTENGDVYVPGQYYYQSDEDSDDDYYGSKPVCWKNTTRIDMNIPGYSEGNATHVFVNGSDLYVSGNVDGDPCYWKNSQLVYLDTPSVSQYGEVGSSSTNNMHIQGSDVYIGGCVNLIRDGKTYYTPMYWKNGIASIVPIAEKPNATGGVWGFSVCDDIVIPRGSWSNSQGYGDFCVIDGTVYFTERTH